MKKPILILSEEEQNTILRGLDLLESQVKVGGSFPEFESKLFKIRKKIHTFQAENQGYEIWKDK